MDVLTLFKAGFIGFALSVGVLMLVFFIVGRFFLVTEKTFVKVFVLAGVASFLVIDVFLYYKIHQLQSAIDQVFLAAVIGGWLGGIVSGLTNMKRFLIAMAK
jgi:hypothetical protein